MKAGENPIKTGNQPQLPTTAHKPRRNPLNPKEAGTKTRNQPQKPTKPK
jgi:hypothetical protein